MEIKNGCKVKVDYTGTLENGQVFDSSEGREPLEFVAGAKMIIKGFDEAVMGMKEGEEKEIKLTSDQAYGERKPELVQTVPKSAFGDKFDAKEGQQMMLRAPTGQEMMAKVTKIEGENVTIDMNHPLCGQALNFKLKIASVEEAALHEEHECTGCGAHDHHIEKDVEDIAKEIAEEDSAEESEEKVDVSEEESEVPEEKAEESTEELDVPEEKSDAPEEKSEETDVSEKESDASEEKADVDEVKDALGGNKE